MSNVVGALSVSHAPGLLGWPDDVTDEEHKAVFAAYDHLKVAVDKAQPDLIVAFLDDHFENHYRNLMPSITIAVADEHIAPAQQYLELLKVEKPRKLQGARESAECLLQDLVGMGFDVARMGPAEFGNNLVVPLELIRPQYDIPIIPVFINVFTPPLITMRRAYELGSAVRAVVESWPEKIMFWGTGGLSHWPPFWGSDRQSDAFLERMRKFQAEGRTILEKDPALFTDLGTYEIETAAKVGNAVVNPEWDEEVMRLFAKGEIDALAAMSYSDIEAGGGHGGHEIRNWMAVAGAMHGANAEPIVYRPTPAWICGTGCLHYPSR